MVVVVVAVAVVVLVLVLVLVVVVVAAVIVVLPIVVLLSLSMFVSKSLFPLRPFASAGACGYSQEPFLAVRDYLFIFFNMTRNCSRLYTLCYSLTSQELFLAIYTSKIILDIT